MSEQAKEIEIKLSEDSGDEELDTGKSGGNFPLWAAQEAISLAQDHLSDLAKSRESLAKTAAALMGWSVPISGAMIGVLSASFDHVNIYMKFLAAGALSCTVAGAYTAFWGAIKIRKWESSGIHPDQWIEIINALPGTYTELDILRERTTAIANAIDHNEWQLKHVAKYVDRASILLMGAPAMAIIFFLIYFLASCAMPNG